MKKIILHIRVLLIFAAAGISSCDAPRNNPFDPYNEESPFVILDGIVMSELSSEPLPDVKVTFLPYNISAYSDKDGLFSFDYFEKKDGWLKFERTGYFIDSVLVEWGGYRKKSFQMELGSKPKLMNLQYYSVVQNRYNLPSIDYIFIKTKVSELGNTIDSVFLRYSGEHVKTLDFNISTKFFESTLDTEVTGFSSIDDFIGKEMEIVVTNSLGKETIAGILNIQRVIRSEIEPVSPSPSDEIYLPINFVWNKFTPGFSFSYLLQIYTNEVEPRLVSQKAFASSGESYQYGSFLNSGSYFWVVWCIDEFGNRNRSKPLGFTLR